MRATMLFLRLYTFLDAGLENPPSQLNLQVLTVITCLSVKTRQFSPLMALRPARTVKPTLRPRSSRSGLAATMAVGLVKSASMLWR